MTLWNLAVVVGVPGVGKTSLCREAARSKGYYYVNYGEMMLEFAEKGKIASTQEEMLKLPLNIQFEIWRKTANYIKDLTDNIRDLTNNRNNSNGVLVDLHGIDKSKKGYLISLPLEIIKPQIIITIESTYNRIIQHRINDTERTRNIERLKDLKQEMELLRNSMSVCSALLGSYFVVIENHDFEESLIRFKKYL